VLAPIAMTIVENRFPEGDQFLFVKGNGEAIQVEFVDPDAPEQPSAMPVPADGAVAIAAPPLARMILSPAGADEERAQLGRELAALVDRVEGAGWVAEKDTLLKQINSLGFWGSSGRFSVVDRMERMDRIEAGTDTARSLMRRLEQPGTQRARAPGSIVSTLAQQLYLLKAALADLDAGVPADVFLAVEPVGSSEQGAARDAAWARTVLQMYEGWSRKRRMRANLLGEGKDTSEGTPLILSITGFGAHQILTRERGLHVLEVPESDAGYDRSTARVRVVAQPVEPRANRSERDHAIACLQAAGTGSNTVVRRYRERPSPLVRDALGGWRTGRIGQVLGGDFDLLG
jgi:ATP-dependent Clp protease ATP-binding subunit ClpC